MSVRGGSGGFVGAHRGMRSILPFALKGENNLIMAGAGKHKFV
jgi:hypothetical protein